MGKFSQFKINLTEEQYNDKYNYKGKGERKESRIFKPGDHEVIIKDAKETGPNRRDNDWIDYELQLEGAGGKQIRHWLSVPTTNDESPILDGRFPGSTYKKLKSFLQALGVTVDRNNVADALDEYFTDPSRLVGMHVKINVGFRGIHLETQKGETGSLEYKLVGKNGDSYCDEVFDSADAAKAYVQQNDIKGFDDFPKVLSFQKSQTANDTKKVVKRVLGKVTPVVDLN